MAQIQWSDSIDTYLQETTAYERRRFGFVAIISCSVHAVLFLLLFDQLSDFDIEISEKPESRSVSVWLGDRDTNLSLDDDAANQNSTTQNSNTQNSTTQDRTIQDRATHASSKSVAISADEQRASEPDVPDEIDAKEHLPERSDDAVVDQLQQLANKGSTKLDIPASSSGHLSGLPSADFPASTDLERSADTSHIFDPRLRKKIQESRARRPITVDTPDYENYVDTAGNQVFVNGDTCYKELDLGGSTKALSLPYR